MRIFSFLLLLPLVVASPACAEALSLLPSEKIIVETKSGPHSFTVEIAADPKSQQRGLMYRSHMDADAGMLFDFHQPQPVSFWMENTFIPLDMLFVRKDGSIANIREKAVPFSRDSIYSDGDVQLVIEINGGRARALGIAAGAKVHAPELRNMPPAK